MEYEANYHKAGEHSSAGFPPSTESRRKHHEKMETKKAIRKVSVVANMIEHICELEAAGHDFRAALLREDLPEDLLATPIKFIHPDVDRASMGCPIGAEKASTWIWETMTIGGLFVLLRWRHEDAKKNAYGIALMTPKPGKTARRKDDAASWTGVAFDDDNHQALGRDVLTKKGGPLRCCFSTASDGKHTDTFPANSYTGWAKRENAPSLRDATDETIAQFLNDGKHGEPHRCVVVERTPSGWPKVSLIDGEYHVHFNMEPQTRTRTIVPFEEPIEGKLLDELITRGLVKKVCEAIELDIFGVIGHDEKTKTVNAVAFLPTGTRREFFYHVCGDAYLYDAIATARRVLAENPPRPKSERVSNASWGKVGGLRGLMLATMIEERFPELMRGTKTNPLVLDRCPFADGHSSKRGEADGSAFVYDADAERTGYPVVKCHHDSCRDYSTKDFVNEMIRNGDLPADIYDDQDYRIELE